MPNFDQLPQSDHTNADDILPINQAGRTVAVSVATLQSSLQPEIILPRNMLLGRTSIGSGGPEPITVGPGLSLLSGTLSVSQTALAGAAGPAGQGFLFRGAWAASTAYAAYDVVTHAGQTYVATATQTSATVFDPTAWTLMAAQGATGATGPQGPKGDTGATGPAGTGTATTVGTTAGTVAAGDDPRIVNALQPTGTRSIAVSDPANAIPWGTIRTNYDQLKVNLGATPVTAWPGQGIYGTVAAVTGAVSIPATADANLIGSVPGIIVASGVTGLAVTHSAKAPGVAGYFGAQLGAANGNVWALNPTVANYVPVVGATPAGNNGQVNGIEIDVGLNTPTGGWGGSNAVGLSLEGTFQTQPDGRLSAIQVATTSSVAWKTAMHVVAGAASYARVVEEATSGPGPSIGTFDQHQVRDAAGNVVQIISGYDYTGRWVVRPLLPSPLAGSGVGFVLQDATGNNCVVLDGASGGVTAKTAGFSGDVQARTVTVSTGASINGAPVATQSYVTAQIQAVVGAAPAALATLQAIDAQLSSDESAASALTTLVSSHTTQIAANTGAITANANAIATRAPTASPALTGVPTAPTPAAGDSSTTVATTAFVGAAVANALPNVGIAGTYGQVTTDAKGRVTSGQVAAAIACGGTGATTAAAALTNLGALGTASNLSDLTSTAAARTNLGLSAVAASGSYADLANKPTVASLGGLATASNLADLGNAAAARTSLGLGSAATQASTAFDAAGAAAAIGTSIGILTPARIVTAGASITVLATDGVIKIAKPVPSATTVTLEANPVTGATHTIKDGAGNAALYPITVSPASGTIEGATSFTLNSNRQSVTLVYDGTEWSVI